MSTIGERLTATNGRPSGFDYIRIVLALGIICFHSVVTCYGVAAQLAFVQAPIGLLIAQLVPMFFCLSGFLVAGSLARTRTVVSFLILRVMRIFPALCVEIVLSAFLLGVIFTVLPLRVYFENPDMWSYLNNCLGGVLTGIHYYLPGVFVHNPSTRVNGQLWTVPGELWCYVTLTVLFVLGIVQTRLLLLTLFGAAQVFFAFRGYFVPVDVGFQVPAHVLVMCFIAGVLLYLFRDRIAWDWKLFIAAVILSFGLPLFRNGSFDAPIPIAYMTVYLGMLNPKTLRLPATGDYSYGLYLYGYPIQQAVSAISPSLRHWWLNILIGVPVAFAFAALSWHVLEKHVLQRKDIAYRAEARVLLFLATVAPRLPRPVRAFVEPMN